LPEDGNKTLCFFKKLNDVQKNKIVSINVIHAEFSVLCTRDDLAMQALVWLCMVQFRAIWFGMVQFGASHVNLR